MAQMIEEHARSVRRFRRSGQGNRRGCRSAIRRGPNGLATCDQSILGSVFRSSATLAVYRLLYSVGIGPTVATQFKSLGLLKDRSIRTIAHPLGGWTPSTKSSNTARACFIGNLHVNVARLKPSPTASRPIMLSAHQSQTQGYLGIVIGILN